MVDDLGDADDQADRYARRMMARTFERFENAEITRLQIITVSVPNCRRDQLRAVIRDLRKAWRGFHQMFLEPSGISGSLPVLEVVDNTEAGRPLLSAGQSEAVLHPHLHALVCDCWLDWSKAWDYWEYLTGERSQIDFSRDPSSERYHGWKPTLKQGINYALKYVQKSRIDPALNGRYHKYSVLGSFRMSARTTIPQFCGACWTTYHYDPVNPYPRFTVVLDLPLEQPVKELPWRASKG